MDNEVLATALVIAGLLALLGSGLWIFASMLLVSMIGLYLLKDYSLVRIGAMMQSVQWRTMTSFELAALPLFVWMGEILFRTRLSEQIFRGMAPWVNWLPGRLLHVVVLACGVFGSVSGSSAATCATISKIALPELKRRGYSESLTIGSLCAGGTLGILIPPSIIMVLYAVAAEVSLIKLMIAGFLPGFLMMGLFSAYIIVWSLLPRHRTPGPGETLPLRERFALLLELGPLAALLVFVFGALFAGWITATECAAWGVLGSILVALQSRAFSWAAFWDSVHATVRTSCMIIILIAAAGFMSSFMAVAGIPKAVAGGIASLELNRYALIALLTVRLHGARHLPRRGVDDPPDASGRAAHRRGGGLRPDLVRHLPHHRDRDGGALAARRLQPVRPPKHDRPRRLHHRLDVAALLPDDGRYHRAPHDLAADRDHPAKPLLLTRITTLPRTECR